MTVCPGHLTDWGVGVGGGVCVGEGGEGLSEGHGRLLNSGVCVGPWLFVMSCKWLALPLRCGRAVVPTTRPNGNVTTLSCLGEGSVGFGGGV